MPTLVILYVILLPEKKAERVIRGMDFIFTPGAITGLVIGFLLVALICMIFIWRRWRKQKILRKRGLIPG